MDRLRERERERERKRAGETHREKYSSFGREGTPKKHIIYNNDNTTLYLGMRIFFEHNACRYTR